MKIYITLTEEPIYINPFVKSIIEAIPQEIVGIGIQCGKSVVVGKGRTEKIRYLLTLAVISDPWNLIKRFFKWGSFIVLEKAKVLGLRNPLSIVSVARKHNIPVSYWNDLNSSEFIKVLQDEQIDVVINQAQVILRREFIQTPKVGCVNRHAALLPKYRGRLAPFWAYLKGETETGLSIHFIDERLDNGPVIVQKRIPIRRFDTVDTLLDRVFLEVASDAMLEALSLIRSGQFRECLLKNDNSLSSYYSSPGLKDALTYRVVMLRRMFLGK